MIKLVSPWRYALAATLLTVLGTGLAASVALATPFNAHPDERQHVDAFCYFQARLWLPPVNSDGLTYSRYGDSRVYTGEIVYWVYGRSAALLAGQPAAAGPSASSEQALGAQLAA